MTQDKLSPKYSGRFICVPTRGAKIRASQNLGWYEKRDLDGRPVSDVDGMWGANSGASGG